jgi:non-lysosomal glucosylceramidase
MRGVRQYCDPIVPKKATCQNYVNELAILAEGGDKAQVTFLPSYDLDDGNRWGEFIRSGQFLANSPGASLFQPGGRERASAVALKQRLAAGESKTVRFLVVWYFPELRIDYKNAHPNSYFGAADYGRYFHNYFMNITDLIAYGCRERDRILAETQSWQTPILESTYPDWLKFKILNSSVAVYNNSILNKAGAFALLEGAMGGLAGTMDVRTLAFEFYQKFCPELDRSEMDLFTATQEPSGKVLHFDGQYYVGLADKDGKTPVPGNAYVCNTGGWLTQLARDYQQTGDLAYITPKQEGIRRALGYLRSLCRGNLHVPQGTIMFDDTEHPPACSYNATMYIAYLQAGEILATALGDKDLADECRGLIEQVRADIYKYLWNGRMLAYGCDSDGTNRRDDMVFVAQLGGQFMSRSHMFGDALPMELVRAAAFGQFKSTLWHFRNQDYFAARVWNAEKNQPDKNVGGQDAICWTFYEDVFRAFPSFQAGYVEDALNILRHTQLAHLRNGYNWTQNLWNIGELSRMDVPLAWWMTDLMASAGLSVPDQTLYLAPVIRPGETRVRLPVYFPDFWAMVECDTQAKTVRVRVTKVFGKKTISIRKVVARPVGVPADKGHTIDLPGVFSVAPDAVLDLSAYWPQLTASVQYPEALPGADQADYLTVAAPRITASPRIAVQGWPMADHVTATLAYDDPDGKLFYTLDGRDPCRSGVVYAGPLMLRQSGTLKVRAFRKDTGWSPPRIQKIEVNAKHFGVNCGGGAGEGLNADQAYGPGGWGYVGGNEAGPAGVMQPGCAYPFSLTTCRFGNFEYRFDLPNGRYAVRLHFAEQWGAGKGGRSFNVQIQDRPVLEKLDVFAEAGGANRALVKAFDAVEVRDGTLTIRFTTLANSAMVGAIELSPVR